MVVILDCSPASTVWIRSSVAFDDKIPGRGKAGWR